jgi:RHS repeat-associated protein
VALTRQYDAWGNLQAGASEPGYAFTGREWDPEIGLYYYRARLYDPRVGRFNSEDPVRFRDGLTKYAYALSNPLRFVDPLGREALPPAPKCGGNCPHKVFTAYFNLCNGSGSNDASVVRCMTSRCTTKREVKITCIDQNDHPCNVPFSNNRHLMGYVPMGQTDSVVICKRSSDTCLEGAWRTNCYTRAIRLRPRTP